MNNHIRTAIILLVSVAWAVNMVAAVFVKDFKPPTEINAAFTAVIGIVAASYKSNEKSDKEKKE